MMAAKQSKSNSTRENNRKTQMMNDFHKHMLKRQNKNRQQMTNPELPTIGEMTPEIIL